MKRLLVLILALVMILSLAACGSEEVTLVDVTTDQGISFKLPSDITVTEANKSAFSNTETGDNAVVQMIEAGETPLSETTQEAFVEAELSDRTDLVVKSFENNKQINGKEALVCKFTFTSAKGTPITSTLILVADGGSEYVIALSYASDNAEGSLAKNEQAIIDSITVKAA